MARRQRTQKVSVALPTMESAPEQWLRNIRFSGFTFIMLGLVILAVIVLAPSLRLVFEQQAQLAQLTSTVQTQKDAVEELESNVGRWSDPAYVEAQARDRLKYVFPGDFTYSVKGDGTETTTTDGAPISTSIQTTEVDWVHTVVSSLFTAGLTDATAAELDDSQVPVP